MKTERTKLNIAKTKMPVIRNIGLLSFLFGKRKAAKQGRANNYSDEQFYNADELDSRIIIEKSEDFYKAVSTYVVNPFNGMNK